MTDHPPRHSRRDLDRLADGTDDGSPLGEFVVSLRAMGETDGVAPSAALAEFVSSPSHAEEPAVVGAVTPDEETSRMIPQLTALLATTAGKLALTGGVAAAAITGAVVVADPLPSDDVLVTATGDSSTPTTETTVGGSSTSVTSVTVTSTTETTAGTSPSTTSTNSDDTTGVVPVDGVETVPVPGVGSVTYQVVDGVPSLVSVDASAEWQVIDESTPGEVDLSFRAADGRRIDVDIEREDGEIRVRVRDKSDDLDLDDDDSDDRNDDADDDEADEADEVDDADEADGADEADDDLDDDADEGDDLEERDDD